MGLFTVTVLGFAVCIGISGYAIIHYFAKGMNTHDAIQVDPKPSK
ncbi:MULTISPECIES: hypothetical protein [Psychrobacillus]|nr:MULTISPECIES: hypothetical protein [Psychrobacillus]MDI2587102.1 hypothetical protein [Psychrobacillus sp. NEAU-3TGS]GGA46210.1 hypothetical protein GCM10011384_39890 [Psychrobacillus lasiicapitis]